MRRTFTVLAAALLLGIGGGIAYAVTVTTTATSVINACVKKDTGLVRVISAGQSCKASETPLSWNQEGVPGTDGQDATLDNTYRASSGGGFRDGTRWIAESYCDPGDEVLGIRNMQVGMGGMVWDLQVLRNANDQQGFYLLIDGENSTYDDPSGFITPTCLDTALPVHD